MCWRAVLWLLPALASGGYGRPCSAIAVVGELPHDALTAASVRGVYDFTARGRGGFPLYTQRADVARGSRGGLFLFHARGRWCFGSSAGMEPPYLVTSSLRSAAMAPELAARREHGRGWQAIHAAASAAMMDLGFGVTAALPHLRVYCPTRTDPDGNALTAAPSPAPTRVPTGAPTPAPTPTVAAWTPYPTPSWTSVPHVPRAQLCRSLVVGGLARTGAAQLMGAYELEPPASAATELWPAWRRVAAGGEVYEIFYNPEDDRWAVSTNDVHATGMAVSAEDHLPVPYPRAAAAAAAAAGGGSAGTGGDHGWLVVPKPLRWRYLGARGQLTPAPQMSVQCKGALAAGARPPAARGECEWIALRGLAPRDAAAVGGTYKRVVGKRVLSRPVYRLWRVKGSGAASAVIKYVRDGTAAAGWSVQTRDAYGRAQVRLFARSQAPHPFDVKPRSWLFRGENAQGVSASFRPSPRVTCACMAPTPAPTPPPSPEVLCPKPAAPLHVQMLGATASSRRAGGTIRFVCDGPLLLIGPSKATCTPSGIWTTFPACIGVIKKCSHISCRKHSGRMSIRHDQREKMGTQHHCQFAAAAACSCWCWFDAKLAIEQQDASVGLGGSNSYA